MTILAHTPQVAIPGTRTRYHTGHTCQRCGITITYDRNLRYNGACRDCAPILGIKRAA